MVSRRVPYFRAVRLLVAGLLLAGMAATAAAQVIYIGMPRDDLIAHLGQPNTAATMSNREILQFDGGVRIEMRGGRIWTVEGAPHALSKALATPPVPPPEPEPEAAVAVETVDAPEPEPGPVDETPSGDDPAAGGEPTAADGGQEAPGEADAAPKPPPAREYDVYIENDGTVLVDGVELEQWLADNPDPDAFLEIQPQLQQAQLDLMKREAQGGSGLPAWTEIGLTFLISLTLNMIIIKIAFKINGVEAFWDGIAVVAVIDALVVGGVNAAFLVMGFAGALFHADQFVAVFVMLVTLPKFTAATEIPTVIKCIIAIKVVTVIAQFVAFMFIINAVAGLF